MKPDAAVDDWEAIATDEEKGESSLVHAYLRQLVAAAAPDVDFLFVVSVSELKKVHIEVKEETAAPPQPTGSEEEDEEDEEEDEDDDEDDDEDEEGSDEEGEAVTTSQTKKTPAKESEEETSESDDDDGRTKEERLYDRAKRRIEVSETPEEQRPASFPHLRLTGHVFP